ncbi:MAG TPA: hypothetical protein VFW42_04565, partial [Fluviicoccus sp.]|nr:hypothetical protein [Fluviicoccus sp.]
MLAYFHAVHWPRIRTLIRLGAWLAAVLLALSLILYVVALQLFARAGEYRPQLERQISATLSAPVRIEHLEATWQGLRPEFTLTGVRLQDPAQPARELLLIPRIRIEPALRQSLLQLALRFNVRVEGLSLGISQSERGEWRVDELAMLPAGSDESRKKAVKWVLSQAEWRLADTRLRVSAYSQPAALLDKLQIINRNGRSRHQLRVNGKLAGVGPVRLMADMTASDVLSLSRWSGTVFASLPEHEWSAWLPALDGISASRLHAGIQAWLELGEGSIGSAYVRVQATELDAVIRERSLHVAHTLLDASYRR